MSLYGYPREPQASDDDAAEPPALPQRIPGPRPAPETDTAAGSTGFSWLGDSGRPRGARHRAGDEDASAADLAVGDRTGDEIRWGPAAEPPVAAPEATLAPEAMLAPPRLASPPSPPLGVPVLGQPAPGQPLLGPPPLAPPPTAPPSPAPSPAPLALGQPPLPPLPATSSDPAAPNTDRVATAPREAPTTSAPGRSVELTPMPLDEPDIPPWDRRPLLVVIAAALVLVLIGVAAGVLTSVLVEPDNQPATWHDGASALPTPGTDSPDPAVAPIDDTISFSAVGDIVMGSYAYGQPPNGGAGFFNGVKDALAADLVVGNLEQVLSPNTGNKCAAGSTTCFQFALPTSYASVLKDAGFQMLNLANNHGNDMGPTGRTSTREALTAVGLAYAGGPGEIAYVQVKGVTVAMVGFSSYNWTANLNDIPAAAALVRQADEKADLVLVQFHGGAEGTDKTRVPPAGTHEYFLGEDRGDLRSFAHAMVDAGADLVLGHGPHVLRGIEFYQGRLIEYSLGNFAGYRALSAAGYAGVGAILTVTLHRDGSWRSGTLIATEMVNGGYPALDTDRRALPFVDGLSQQDFGASAVRVDHQTGVLTVPSA